MNYVKIDAETLISSCSHCGMPVPKTVAEVVIHISKWPLICMKCKLPANEIRYVQSKQSHLVLAKAS